MPGNYKKDDLRVIRTRKALLEALPSLLSRRCFTNITVNDICGEAQLSRAAFYARFQDKYDFLKYYLLEQKPEIVCDKCDYESFERIVNAFVRKRTKIITNLFRDTSNETLEILKEFIVSVLNVPHEKSKNGKQSQSYIVISHFCAGGIVNLLNWQIRNDFPLDSQLANGDLYLILKNLLSWDDNNASL